MNEDDEVASTGNEPDEQESQIGEIDQLAQTTTSVESLAQNPLLAKLQAIRQNALLRTENLSLLAQTIQNPPGDVSADDDAHDLETLAAHIEELSHADIPTADYLSKTGRLLHASQQARTKAMAAQEAAQDEHDAQRRAIRGVESKLEELDAAQGIRRLTGTFSRRKLTKQQSAFAQTASELQARVDAQRQLAHQGYEGGKLLTNKQNEAIIKEGAVQIRAIMADYELFLQEVLEDGTMAEELQDAYIQQVIVPLFDQSHITIPNEKREAYTTALKMYLQNPDAPAEERDKLRQAVEACNQEEGFYYLRNASWELMRSYGTDIVTKLVAHTAASDVNQIRDIIDPHMPRDGSLYYVQGELRKAINPNVEEYNRQHNTLGEVVTTLFLTGDGYKYPNMLLWSALKSSQRAQEVFPDSIREMDEKILSEALIKSLTDVEGEHIDILASYPRPEAIRNLVILAAADHRNYRTSHANNSLRRLAERDDWDDVLDQVEQQYPELASARPFLQKWIFSEQYNNPGFQNAAKEFTEAVMDDDSADTMLRDLAVLALPNVALVENLHKQGIIPDAQAVHLFREAEAILEQVAKEWFQIGDKYRESAPHITAHHYQHEVRQQLLGLIDARAHAIEGYQQRVAQLAVLSKHIIENKSDEKALDFSHRHDIVHKIATTSLSNEAISVLLNSYKECPDLLVNYDLLRHFCHQFTGPETVMFFKNINVAFEGRREQLWEVLRTVGVNELEQARALELPVKASDILDDPLFSLTMQHPTLYLATDADLDFFRSMKRSYQDDADTLDQASKALADSKLSREMAVAFPQHVPSLMDKKMREIRLSVLRQADSLLQDASDLKFLNTVVGEFGHKSDVIIRGYKECLDAQVITPAEKDLVLEFSRQFRVISPVLLKTYKEAKEGGYEKVYIAQLTALAEKMTGSAVITDEERERPYYKDLLQHVYSNNSGNWTTFQNNESCADRSGDLAAFKVQSRYEMDLLSQSEIRVKAGQELIPQVKEDVQAPILAVSKRMGETGFDYDQIKADLDVRISEKVEQIIANGGLLGLDLEGVTTPEEKLFLVLADSMYGTRSIDSATVKDLLISYEFAYFEDISDYIAGTNDRVSRANNPDYALFCEVGAFYSDRVKEVNRRLVESAWNNPTIAALMPEYFQKLAQETANTQRRDTINRMQVDRLGLSDGFVAQMRRVLENEKRKKGRKYTPDEVRRIVQRYEGLAGGLVDQSSESSKEHTRAFYGQLRSQREKTMDAVRFITGDDVDPATVHLGEVNLQQVLDVERAIREGVYDEEQFASYTVQRFIDIFDVERTQIEGELAKFESDSGKQREVLYGYMAKTKESAHARMVGGVCVSGDNPAKNPNKNMWDMPNYFQLVLQEPDTLQCAGAVLLHHFTQDGKRVLAASLNPSSTYLYSVDERALFEGLMSTIEQFAHDNDFDMITISKAKAIRTNRTGGEFEKAMDARVKKVDTTFTFDAPQQFSYTPDYKLQEMDVVWLKPAV